MAREPRDAGGRLSAIAARANDDDDDARRSDGGCGCLSGSDQHGWRRLRSWRRGSRWRGAWAESTAASAERNAAALHDGESCLLSGAIGSAWVHGIGLACRDDVLRAPVRRRGVVSAGESVSGRVGDSPEASESVLIA